MVAAPIDRTNDPKARSWVESARGHPDFPLQNLPFGVFQLPGNQPRCGIAIGDKVLDLSVTTSQGLLSEAVGGPVSGSDLAPLMAAGPAARRTLRTAVFDLLLGGSPAAALGDEILVDASACAMLLPAAIGDYTDFFSGIHHAASGGRRRSSDPTQWLPANYHHMPIAYHSRASSVRVSGAELRRPWGQSKLPDEPSPSFGASRKLDHEFEIAAWMCGGNALGEPVPIANASRSIFGFCLLNDWSARDIQRWEMAPLGAFLSKNFLTSVSPWIITPEALAPFAAPAFARDADQQLLPYLFDTRDQASGGLWIEIETYIETEMSRNNALPPQRISKANATDLYWTFGQMIAHHTITGCNLRPADLIASGTVSGAGTAEGGSMIELSVDGATPIVLATSETRSFLEDGDELILQARCRRDGFVGIGFGECRGRVTPALAHPMA